jgi:tetratricopeptide (TPR) repeat protein
MVKSLILFLNFLLLPLLFSCQTRQPKLLCDCSSKIVQDSLIEKYIDNGAQKLNHLYNNPNWQLYCDSLIALCPNIAVSYQQKAVPFIKNGDYAIAFPLEDKAVELDPKRYMAYRGFCKFLFMKDYEGAIVDFQKAQQLTPNGYEMDHTYFFYEGVCNLELSDYSKSEKNFEHDILIQTGGDKKKSIHFNTLLYVGILYYEMKKNDKAKEYLLKCLSEYPEFPDANYYLALVYKSENNNALKKKYLEIAREKIKQRFGINEDGVYYANYPYQITLYEIEQEIKNK